MPLVRFDFSNVVSKRAGANGLSAKEFARIKRQAGKLKEALARKRKEKKLSFAELPYRSEWLFEQCARLNVKNMTGVLVLGMGGSSLGVKAIEEALPKRKPVYILDNIDPDTVKEKLDKADKAKTLVCIITKSGATVETLALFLLLRSQKKKIPDRNIVFITADKNSEFSALAKRENFNLLMMPQSVSGRFSVLTSAGLFPAYSAGYAIDRILDGAREMADYLWTCAPEKDPSLLSAAILHALCTKKGKTNQVIMPYSDRLQGFALWYAQLLAESLGKRFNLEGRKIHAGITPVIARGASDQHSQLQLYLDGPRDKTVAFVAVENFKNVFRLKEKYSDCKAFSAFSGRTLAELFTAERQATAKALTEAGVPNLSFSISEISERAMGALFYFFEIQVAAMAQLWGVNPFDQPGVEAIKEKTRNIMRRTKRKIF